MKKSFSAVVYERHGNPAEVLRVEKRPWPQAGVEEAVVQMCAAPINPADINMIEGKYPVRLPLPATPGMEGAGKVVKIGANVQNVQPGDLVIIPHNIGTWRGALAISAAGLIVVPPEIDPMQASMLKVNPLTAWRLLQGFVALQTGDWLIQNAANSAAGRAVIQIAHELGYKTVNVVRRADLVAELQGEGGDVVLLDDDNLREAVKTATGGAPIHLALNAVGGESALRLANTVAPDGTMVTYGAMSLQPLRIPNGLLIFKNLNFRGLWINKWYDGASAAERMAAFAHIFSMAGRGLLRTKIEKAYVIDDVLAAVAHASAEKRGGKIVFDLSI